MPRVEPDSRPDGTGYRSLRGRDAFSNVFHEGVRSRRGGVTVVAAPGRPGPAEVGLVAGKRVGNAVRRNRAKRRLRAALRSLPLAPGTAYVVIAGSEVPDVEYRRLVGWLTAAVDGVSAKRTKERR